MRPIVYDLTHLEVRSRIAAPTGIDRVDFAYARHFSRHDRIVAATHYGPVRPKVLPPSALTAVVDRASAQWGETAPVESDVNFLHCRAWIIGRTPQRSAPARQQPRAMDNYAGLAKRRMWMTSAALSATAPPEGALYLNVAQHRLEKAAYFDWLSARKDVIGVFFLHDLLPLDFREYWKEEEHGTFLRRVDTVLRHASALITASHSVRERVLRELDSRGKPRIPIFSHPLPSAFGGVDRFSERDHDLGAEPYFVVVGTIEPRKNHLLLLNIWRRLEAVHPTPPKLVVIGARGWENEQVVDMLERCDALHGLVWETTGLSNAGMRRLIANARALLMPSFAEGFGLPIVEALSLGVPVIASDIPVFHEVAQERAIFRDAIDGPGWLHAIEAMIDPRSPLSLSAREAAEEFSGCDEDSYFSAVCEFLAGL